MSGVVYDVCPDCKGLWLDAGELGQVLAGLGGLEVPSEPTLIEPKPVSSSCPRCRKPLEKGGFISPVLLVEKCASCGGVWLDSGELLIIRKLMKLPPRPDGSAVSDSPIPAAETAGPGLGSMPDAPPERPGLVAAPDSVQHGTSAGAAPAVPEIPVRSFLQYLADLPAWAWQGFLLVVSGLASFAFGGIRFLSWARGFEASSESMPSFSKLPGSDAISLGFVLFIVGLSLLFTRRDMLGRRSLKEGEWQSYYDDVLPRELAKENHHWWNDRDLY